MKIKEVKAEDGGATVLRKNKRRLLNFNFRVHYTVLALGGKGQRCRSRGVFPGSAESPDRLFASPYVAAQVRSGPYSGRLVAPRGSSGLQAPSCPLGARYIVPLLITTRRGTVSVHRLCSLLREQAGRLDAQFFRRALHHSAVAPDVQGQA